MSKKIAITLIITGVCVMIFSMVANMSGWINHKNYADYSINYNDNNESIDVKEIELVTKQFDQLHNIKIDSDVSNIEIIQSDKFEIVYAKEYFELSVNDDQINLEQIKDLKFNNNNNWFSTNNHSEQFDIIVCLPTDFNKNIEVITDIGDILISGNIKINNLDISSDVGNVEIEKDLIVKNMILKANIGNVSISDNQINNAIIKCDIGSIDFENVLFNKAELVANLGDIDVEMININEFTNIDKGLFEYHAINESCSIDIKTDIGSIDVE